MKLQSGYSSAGMLPPLVTGLLIYGFSGVLLAGLIFSGSGFISNDDYYHTRLALMILEQGSLHVDFSWLPLTILSPAEFVDHHLLFHLYLAPWAAIGGMGGVRLATVSVAAGIVVAIWSLLRRSGLRYAGLWSLAYFVISAPFLSRMLMIRTQGAAVLLLLVMLNLLARGRYRWLLPVTFAFAWLYNGYILIIAAVVLYMVAAWVIDRRLVWQPVVYVLVGVIAGLVINPYFPQNIQFSLHHLGAKVDFSSGIRVGDEWYPYTTAELFANSTGALLLFAVGLLLPGLTGQKYNRMTLTAGLMAGVTLFMVLQSKRFIEYFPPFALVFAALAVGQSSLTALLPGMGRIGIAGRYGRWLLPLAGIIVLLVAAGRTLPAVYDRVLSAKAHETFAGASAWLRDHAAPDTLIFQTDWDDFTRLFYYNPQNVYVSGLDPTYFQLANPDLWEQWEAIRRGEVSSPSRVIRDDFGATYVVSDRRHDAFERQAENDPALELVYSDRYSYVWQVVPEVLAASPMNIDDLRAEKTP